MEFHPHFIELWRNGLVQATFFLIAKEPIGSPHQHYKNGKDDGRGQAAEKNTKWQQHEHDAAFPESHPARDDIPDS